MNYKHKKQLKYKISPVQHKIIKDVTKHRDEMLVYFSKIIVSSRDLVYWQDKIDFNIRVLTALVVGQIILAAIYYV